MPPSAGDTKSDTDLVPYLGDDDDDPIELVPFDVNHDPPTISSDIDRSPLTPLTTPTWELPGLWKPYLGGRTSSMLYKLRMLDALRRLSGDQGYDMSYVPSDAEAPEAKHDDSNLSS